MIKNLKPNKLKKTLSALLLSTLAITAIVGSMQNLKNAKANTVMSVLTVFGKCDGENPYMELSWSKEENVTGYKVMRMSEDNSKWTEVADVSNVTLSETIKYQDYQNINSGTWYHYYLKLYNQDGHVANSDSIGAKANECKVPNVDPEDPFDPIDPEDPEDPEINIEAHRSNLVMRYKIAEPASPLIANQQGQQLADVTYQIALENQIIAGDGQTARQVVVQDTIERFSNGGTLVDYKGVKNALLKDDKLIVDEIRPGQETIIEYHAIYDTNTIPKVALGQTTEKSEVINAARIVSAQGVEIGLQRSDKASARLQGGIQGAGETSTHLTIEKLVSNTPSNYQVANNEASAVNLGSGTKTAYYQVKLKNPGNTAATQVVLEDSFQAVNGVTQTNITNVSPASEVTYDATHNAFWVKNVPARNGVTFTYQATITEPITATQITQNEIRIRNFETTATDSSGINLKDPAYIQITNSETEESITDLTISKAISVNGVQYSEADTDAADFGNNATAKAYYLINIENSGDTDATNVVIADTIVDGIEGATVTNIQNVAGATYDSTNSTFKIDRVEANSSVDISYEADVTASTTTEEYDIVTNTAEINSLETTATVINGIGLTNAANLKIKNSTASTSFDITKSVSKENLSDDDTATYTIKVKNNSNSEQTITLTDTIGDSNNGYIEGTLGAKLIYQNDLNVLNANHTGDIDETTGVELTIAANAECTLTYTVKADAEDLDPEDEDTIVNIAVLSSGEEAEAELDVLKEELDFEISKISSKKSTKDGDEITYRIRIKNNNDYEADVTLTDTIGKGNRGYINGSRGGKIVFIDGSLDVDGIRKSDWDGDIDDSDGIEFENVEPNQTVTVEYKVKVDGTGVAKGTESRVENNAEIEWDGGDDADNERITINGADEPEPKGNLTISKSSNVSNAKHNEIVVYTIQVKNNSSENAKTFVTDTIGLSGFITGDNGGKIEYVPASQTVAGAYNSYGNINDIHGITLELEPYQTATITYQGKVDTSNITVNQPSQIENIAVLADGQSATTIVTISQEGGIIPPPPIHQKSGTGILVTMLSSLSAIGLSVMQKKLN